MSTYSWQIPGPPVAPPPSSGSAAAAGLASTPSDLAGLLDVAFDPISRDLVDADDGGILETTDSRTAVIFQMEGELNAWWADPTQGSRIRAIISGVSGTGEDEPADVLMLADEVKRCLQPLVDESIIFDLVVALDTDESDRPVVLINYRDASTGHPVDLAFVPFAP